MKRYLSHLRNAGLSLLLLGTVACQRCREEVDFGNPGFKLQLKSQNNQDLWFGNAAIFDPDSIQFIHKTRGLLQHTVNKKARAVELIFPPTYEKEQEISVVLNRSDSDKITYSTSYMEEACSRGEKLHYLNFEGKRMCTNCGDGRFNTSTVITLRKNL